MTASPSHLCPNRRPALGGRDVGAKKRSRGCTPSHPSCETWQCEGPEHLENRWVLAPASSATGAGPQVPRAPSDTQVPSGPALRRICSGVFLQLRKRELVSGCLAALPFFNRFFVVYFYNYEETTCAFFRKLREIQESKKKCNSEFYCLEISSIRISFQSIFLYSWDHIVYTNLCCFFHFRVSHDHFLLLRMNCEQL